MTAVSAILPAEPVVRPLTGSPAESSTGDPRPKGWQRIVLTGFMGSGKSTVGHLLAERLRWQFCDLDTCIEARLGLTVPQIFTAHGEPSFRAAEVHDLALLLAGSERVIALGGGAPGTQAVRSLLAKAPATATVHLSAPFPVLYERCRQQAAETHATERPLLGDRETTGRRYRERLALYAAVAQFTVAADAGSAATVAQNILQQLKLQ